MKKKQPEGSERGFLFGAWLSGWLVGWLVGREVGRSVGRQMRGTGWRRRACSYDVLSWAAMFKNVWAALINTLFLGCTFLLLIQTQLQEETQSKSSSLFYSQLCIRFFFEMKAGKGHLGNLYAIQKQLQCWSCFILMSIISIGCSSGKIQSCSPFKLKKVCQTLFRSGEPCTF